MLDELEIARGRDEYLITTDGASYIDLITGFGAVLLGHGREAVVDRVRRQLDDVWLTGRIPVPTIDEAARRVTTGLPPQYRFIQFYSSGNEAIEFAIRMATVTTDRPDILGFDRSMHGKSLAASALCWPNDVVELANVHTLPFIHTCSESEILDRLRQSLSARRVAAVFVELIQGSNGAHEASPAFYQHVLETCREYGTLCVVDEVLTGFYRSGHRSYSQALGLAPDILIFGKAMANGFPVSAVVGDSAIDVEPAMLLGSTFSNNPLVGSAVAGTLAEMERLDMDDLLAHIDGSIRSTLSPLVEQGVVLRGSGALWTLEFPDPGIARRVQATAFSANILLSVNDRFVRILPTATISRENLANALGTVHDACVHALTAGSRTE